MAQIVSLKEAVSIVSSHKIRGETITLTGGCFDILHVGHIKFLKNAKQNEDILIVLLESDKKVKQLKGENRPFFSQKERAEVISSLEEVDYVICLDRILNDEQYTRIVTLLKPSTIAVTEGDPLLNKKGIQAERIGAKIKVIPYIKTYSSSRLARLIGLD